MTSARADHDRAYALWLVDRASREFVTWFWNNTTEFNMHPEFIARICHEVNRAYCQALGDQSQTPWEMAPRWQQDSALKGVRHALDNPNAKPSDSHESWLAEKRREGWSYGPVKNPEKKEHPCFVAYDELPPAQRAKDFIFLGVVRALTA